MTRKTQPHRKGHRRPSGALVAMLKGRTTGLYNPQDVYRRTVKRRRRIV